MLFSCTGVGERILYFINNEIVDNFVNQGFMQTPNQDQLDDKTIRRNLTLTSAKIGLNNTRIQCYIENVTSTENNISNISVIKIQGKANLW